MSRAKQQSEGLVVIDRNAARKVVTRITSWHDLKTMQTPWSILKLKPDAVCVEVHDDEDSCSDYQKNH